MSHRASLRILIAVAAAALAVVIALPPIPQDPGYHAFADGRRLAGVPNALNVLSNLPFLLIGLMGLRRNLRRKPDASDGGGNDLAHRWGLNMLFLGIALVSLGSAYYHLAPSDSRLVWDRAPMTIVFTMVLTLVITLWISAPLGARLFMPLLLAGIGSVVIWRQLGDLRAYVFVQFLPLLLIPLILLLFRGRTTGRATMMAAAVGLYALAKAVELLDAPIYSLGHVLSGHTLKHLFAAAAVSTVARSVEPAPPPTTTG